MRFKYLSFIFAALIMLFTSNFVYAGELWRGLSVGDSIDAAKKSLDDLVESETYTEEEGAFVRFDGIRLGGVKYAVTLKFIEDKLQSLFLYPTENKGNLATQDYELIYKTIKQNLIGKYGKPFEHETGVITKSTHWSTGVTLIDLELMKLGDEFVTIQIFYRPISKNL